MTVRTANRAQTDALVAMWNRSACHDPVDGALWDENVWDDPGSRPETTLVCGPPGRVEGFALGVTRPQDAHGVGYLKMLAVAPEARRRGHGRALLSAVEEAFRKIGVRTIVVAGSPPNYLSPGLDDRYEEGLAFLRAHGYRVTGETANMAVDLRDRSFDATDDAARLGREGVTVRRAEPRDWPALVRLLDRFGGTWIDEVKQAMGQSPTGVHLALRGDAPLAFAAWGGNNTAAGWFGPMGTVPEARRLGIGGILLRRCLADLRTLGFVRTVIPWVGPAAAFYEREAGARVTARLLRLEKTLRS